jgi:hypothetical protein
MGKFCPFFFAGPRNTRVTCIEDACACWRVAPPKSVSTGLPRFVVAANPAAVREADAGQKPADGWSFVPYRDEDTPAGWHEPAEQARKRLVGYCGLAGAPA